MVALFPGRSVRIKAQLMTACETLDGVLIRDASVLRGGGIAKTRWSTASSRQILH